MAYYSFKDVTILLKKYTDNTGLITGHQRDASVGGEGGVGGSGDKRVFDLQYNSELFNVKTSDVLDVIIGVDDDDVGIDKMYDYIMRGQIVQFNQDNGYFVTSSGGLIGRFYVDYAERPLLFDVGNECRIYLRTKR